MRSTLRIFPLLIAVFAFSIFAGAQSRSLDGAWQFAVDRDGKWTVSDLPRVKAWREIRVPYSWNVQFADLRDYNGVAWYRKSVDLAPITKDQTVLLKFGAVDYFAEVFVNGTKAGEHEGGYLPFNVDCGKLVKAGTNEIAVRVIDPDSNKQRWGDMNYSEVPHGKQSWYVQTGGIWQSVSLEIKSYPYTKNIKIMAKPDGALEIHVLTNSTPVPRVNDLQVRIFDPSGNELKLRPSRGSGKDFVSVRYLVANPKLWNVDHPNLYTAEVKLAGDTVTERFGIRLFEARERKFYLNGEPIYIQSALDQDFYPEGGYTPPSYDFLVDQMKKAKEIGLNMLRTHIKVPTPDYLRAADETGILIWYEIPSWDEQVWTPEAAKRGEEIFLGEIERDWNHPSVVIQTIINESWGVRELREEHTRKWLKATFKKLAPIASKAGHLTVDNSPCCGNFHLKTDIADYHQYRSIPDNRGEWDAWVAELASRPPWLWSNHGDAEPTGKEPIMVSEFGNWGLPLLPDQLPWWFNRGFRGQELSRPAGVLERFHKFKLDRLFADFNDLARATQRHQWISLKYQIEELRKHASIQGYTITEFTDLNWECNGLLDMFRNKKSYANDLAKLQRQDMIFARTQRYNFTGEEKIELTTHVSRYSNAANSQQTIRCYINGKLSGEANIGEAERGSVVKDQTIVLTAPTVTKPSNIRVQLELRGTDDTLIAQNYVELFIYPEPEKKSDAIYLAGALQQLTQGLRAAGYSLVSTPESGSIVITDTLDPTTQSLLNSGRRVIVLADSKEAIPEGRSIKITPRNSETGFDGNWVSNFNWINTQGPPFNTLTFDLIQGFEAEKVTPKFVIEGLMPEDYGDVMSGIFFGWINKNAALMLGAKCGEGRAIITTFRLAEAYGTDEYARNLLDGIIRLVDSEGFEPKLAFK